MSAGANKVEPMMKFAPLMLCALASASFAADEYSPAAGYYQNVSGTGASLQASIRTAISAGHIQRSYGNFRNASRLFDTNPLNSTQILLAYNRVSVPGSWDSGNTWNREHVWPQSRQSGSASNGSTGNLGDPHALKPCNPIINSQRGNKPFGDATSTGSHGSKGSFYFPGDAEKGDIARSLMYSNTRYGLQLVRGFPSGNQMGDLDALVAWHYADVPDTFERRRNHIIATQSENPAFYTNNRSPFVDLPELVWSVYVDQQNDSRLSFAAGDTLSSGASTLDIVDTVFVDAQDDVAINTVIRKDGRDGTYFSVTASGDVTASLDGKFNAFPVLTGNALVDTQDLQVSLNAPATTAGIFEGVVTIDNLDVTAQGGAGRGANDGDDTLFISRRVVDRAEPSFSEDEVVTTVVLDLGAIVRGSGDFSSRSADLFNLEQTVGFTAALNAAIGTIAGEQGSISVELEDGDEIDAGESAEIIVSAHSRVLPGTYNVGVFIESSDDVSIPGAQDKEDLIVAVSVEIQSCEGDVALGDHVADAVVDIEDLIAVLANFGAQGGTPWETADADGDGDTDIEDLLSVIRNFGVSCR